MKRPPYSLKKYLKSLRFFVFISFLVTFLLAYLYVGQFYVAYGPSMEPTIYDNERLIVDKRAYAEVNPLVDDVVSFTTPAGLFYVKRVVAGGGDMVEVGSDGVKVNSKLLKNTEGPWKSLKYKLAQDEVYVLGDNRLISDDSRDFGPIKVDKISGEVKAVVWPPGSWRLVK